ncbi:MAG: HPr family phosphocarrier protein [Clostridia bacterium]|nr:HPr family phosphocarrier protein [Clostridia bacterium]
MSNHIIRLNTIHQVKDFVNRSSRYPFEITLISGRMIINGKSIMGIFGLDLNSPILMETTGEGEELERFLSEIQEYLVSPQD